MDNQLLAWLTGQQDAFLQMLREFVELESPSLEDKAASDRCGDFLEEAYSSLGFNIQRLLQSACGDHVVGTLGSGPRGVLIVGHFDTVYPVGTIQNMPFVVRDGKAYGPGVLDMKGGVIMTFFAIRALMRFNRMPEKTIGIFFNSDEESGSFYSSDAIVDMARSYENVLVVEPGVNDCNSVKVKRYGRGTYQIIAHGVAAHSGSNPHLAVSPLTELARQLLRIEAWNRETNLATFAPVSISGGIGETCMIPETAHFTMDVRFKEENTGAAIHEKIMALTPITPGVRLEVKGTLDKPVMREYPHLFEKARACGSAFGLDLKGVTIGGGSDGNFTSAAGVPTLDGLGTTGEFLHNPGEYIHVGHMPPRTAMLAKLLESL